MNSAAKILLLAAGTIILVLFPQLLALLVLITGLLLVSVLLFKALEILYRNFNSTPFRPGKESFSNETLGDKDIEILQRELRDKKFSKDAIESFIEELGSELDRELLDDVEIEKKVSDPDMSFEERMEDNFSPVYEVRKDGETVTEISGSFPTEENLSDFNQHLLQPSDQEKRIYLLHSRHPAVLTDGEFRQVKSSAISVKLPGENS